MPSLVLIKNGTVVNEDSIQKMDVLCEDGIITEVGTDLQAPPNAQIVDATDRCVIPGGVDPHTHFELRFRGQVSKDDFFIGTKAALAGGTTTIIDFAIPTKQQLPVEAYHQWRSWADPKVCCDYMLTVAITSWNQEVAKQMELLTQPEYGINNFKFYLACLIVNDAEFYNGLKQCANIGALARVHCENGPIIAEKQKELLENKITGPEGHILCRPEQLEAEAVNRACVLASEANCPLYVVHVMSKKAADVVVRHVEEGKIIFGEALGAGLACTGEAYFSKDWQHAATHVMSPPLSKDPDTPNYLIDLLARDKLNTTGSDNATWCCEQKRQGLYDFSKILSGLNGVEDRLSIVYEKCVHSGKMDMQRFVAITSSTAAKIFNVYPKKGRIAIGSDADIVIWNPNAEKTISARTHHQAVDTNVFEGMVVHGVAEVTVCNGRVVWENNKLNVEAGSGRFIHAKLFCKHVFERIDSKRSVIKMAVNNELAVERFQQYLQIKTEQPNPDYAKCKEFLFQYAKELGISQTWAHECVHGKPIVGFKLEGTDPSLPALMLYSHTDVVPTFPEHWKYDPYSAHKDEKGDIYARGAQDMKCVGIQYVEALRRLLANGKKFARTIHILWGPDEEIGGGDGMKLFVKTPEFKQLNIGFTLDEGLATPDDTYKVYYAERNLWWVKVSCGGSPGHGSKFQDNTAAEKLQSVINSFLAFREEQRKKLEASKDLHLGDVTTINLTKVDGGVQLNVIPAEFNAYFDIRIPPTVDLDAFEKQIKEWCAKAGPDVKYEFLQLNKITNMTPTTKDDPFWNAFSSVLEEMNCKISKEIFVGATDSRYLRELGYKAIGFSPMINTPQLLHDHNEFLNEKVFIRGIDIYENLIERLANVPNH